MIKLVARLFLLKVLFQRLRNGDRGTPPPRSRPSGGSPPTDRGAATATGSSASGGGVPSQRGGDAGPDTPLELPARDWKSTVTRTLKEIKDDRITLIAAGMAYYMFLAIFPAAIAFIGILGLANIDTAPITEAIKENLPGESGAVFIQAIEGAQQPSDSASLTAAAVGFAIALWSASSGFIAMQRGLNVAYDVSEDRKFVGARAVAFALIIATGLLGGVPSPFFTGESTVWKVIGWIATVIAVIVLFSLYYYLGPKRDRPKWQWVSAGGIVGAAIWILSSVGFGLYAGDPSRYAKTYGSLGAVIALIVWLYLTSISILVGGELNAELERQAEKRTRDAGAARG